ncbi:TetR/AcrR family transcriptional regulator [Trichlorobacter lovleyi]|uniref:TetR/AcrR family transcriptional regulator n=1 Tax=Trichlorobacter lovleyi TaxID=313985 RepID=UPI002240C51C|nr:TetR/AcrR family transcriptional regulator [Trichlorobacter lovleyi]QOX80395.1 TetR/AcrR family transcriptional regulator [Trichlorobacter lovleyi]
MENTDKRMAVIQAAMELIAENGFHGTPMSGIAKRAGVAAGTIYHYFESKDALIEATYALLEEQLLESIRQGYCEDSSVQERFLHIGRMLVSSFIVFPMKSRFIEQFHNSPYGVASRRERMLGRKNDLVSSLFEEARQQGLVKDLPLPVIFALSFGPLLLICRDHIFGLITLDDLLIEKTVQACWEALKC